MILPKSLNNERVLMVIMVILVIKWKLISMITVQKIGINNI